VRMAVGALRRIRVALVESQRGPVFPVTKDEGGLARTYKRWLRNEYWLAREFVEEG